MKASTTLGTLLTLFFTSVLAPVLIHILTEAHDRKSDPARTQPTPPPISEERIIALGTGATPEEAWYDAQGKALRAAITPMADAQQWAREGKFIYTSILQDAGRLITRCQDLGCAFDGGVWRREVAVFVARDLLADKLRAAHVGVVGDVLR